MAIKIDVISGFLGAGKTTLIRKLLMDALKGQQVVLIENEFGEIGIDGGFLKGFRHGAERGCGQVSSGQDYDRTLRRG